MICQTTVIVLLDRIINDTANLTARILNFINTPFSFFMKKVLVCQNIFKTDGYTEMGGVHFGIM